MREASFKSSTPKNPVVCNNLGHISYIGRVMADFVPTFVAMATGVGRSKICQASCNSPTPKNPVIRKDLGDIYTSSNAYVCIKRKIQKNSEQQSPIVARCLLRWTVAMFCCMNQWSISLQSSSVWRPIKLPAFTVCPSVTPCVCP